MILSKQNNNQNKKLKKIKLKIMKYKILDCNQIIMVILYKINNKRFNYKN